MQADRVPAQGETIVSRSRPCCSPTLPTLAALACTGALAAALPASASPVEHAVDVSGAVGFVALHYGDHTLNAGLASSLEVDGYTFAGAAGDQIRILLHTLTGGLDPSLVLRGPTGTVLKSASCSGESFGTPVVCSTSLTQTLTASGTMTLNVSDINADEAGNYQLHIERYPPANNWAGLAYGTVNEVAATLGHTTDVDNFAFTGVAGTGVRLTVRTATGGLDPSVEIWGPNGNSMPGTSCSGESFGTPILCTASIDLNITTSGLYKIGITDVGWNETGNYKLSVACQYGACPTAAPVPEPQAYALLAGGLGVIGLMRRRRIARR